MENFALERESSFQNNTDAQTTSSPVFNKIKASVVTGMTKAADALHQQADKSSAQEFTNFGHKTADWLEKSADYVEQLEPKQMRADFEEQVRRNPGKSLLIAGAAGLVLGAIFRGRR